jgi:hypothetical protein
MPEALGKISEIIFLKELCNKMDIDFSEVGKDLENKMFSGKVLGEDILTFKHEAKRYIKEKFNKIV